MQTLKTALVVTFLLAVLYGVFVTLNQPEPSTEAEHFDTAVEWNPPELGPESPSLGDPMSGPPSFSAPMATENPQPELADLGMGPTPSTPEQGYALEVPGPPPSTPNLPGIGPPPTDLVPNDRAVAELPGNSATPGPDSQFPNVGPYGSPYVRGPDTTDVAPDVPLEDPGPSIQPNVPDQTAELDAAATQTKLAEYNFREAWGAAQQHLDAGDYGHALAELTTVYREKHLPPEQRAQLLEMLDQLAGTVIYSTEHRLEEPYIVSRGETLEQIAQSYDVPSLLLFNINRPNISEPDLLLPGTQLKVLQGPFSAEIEVDELDPSRGEATLFLHTLYAGRFPISFGSEKPTPGQTYQVTERLQGKSFFPPSGQPIEAGAPGNPYGTHWIGLNVPGVGLHGGESTDPRGSIRLSNRDAADVFGILSVGSVVKILSPE